MTKGSKDVIVITLVEMMKSKHIVCWKDGDVICDMYSKIPINHNKENHASSGHTTSVLSEMTNSNHFYLQLG